MDYNLEYKTDFLSWISEDCELTFTLKIIFKVKSRMGAKANSSIFFYLYNIFSYFFSAYWDIPLG